MISRKSKILVAAVVCSIAFTLTFLMAPGSANDEPVNVNISPHRIILNARCEGSLQDIQAIISMAIQGGNTITGFDIRLWFNEREVAKAHDLRYCPVDYNFLASFDRAEIQKNAEDLAGQVVTATVEGWYSSNDGVKRYFSGTDLVEIVKPGK